MISDVEDEEDEEPEEDKDDGDEDVEAISAADKDDEIVQIHQEEEDEEEAGFTPVLAKKNKGKGTKKTPATKVKPQTRNSTKTNPSFASVAATTPISKQPKITTFGKSNAATTANLFPIPT